jgi:hypothetical protein
MLFFIFAAEGFTPPLLYFPTLLLRRRLFLRDIFIFFSAAADIIDTPIVSSPASFSRHFQPLRATLGGHFRRADDAISERHYFFISP